MTNNMNTILVAILLLTDMIKYIIFIDIILSWLAVFWLRVRPKIVAEIIDPLYSKIKKIIPSTFWPIDFTPIIVLFVLMIILNFLLSLIQKV